MTARQMTVAEFFCGCGGFSLGFALTGHFRVVLGNDIKRAALRTFVQNHATDSRPPAVLKEDITKLTDRQILDALAAEGIKPGKLDCLLGGPPCQGFSQMRRTTRKAEKALDFGGYDKFSHDSRNVLAVRFLEIVKLLRPRSVVIENVPQILTHYYEGVRGGIAQVIHQELERLNYGVVSGILNAANYGVPQLRERAVFVAIAGKQPSLPIPRFASPEVVNGKHRPWRTVKDAIADLPEPAIGKDMLPKEGTKYNPPASKYARELRLKKGFPCNHVTRKYNRRIIEIIQHMRPGETWDAATERMRAEYDSVVTENRRPGESMDAAKSRLIAEGRVLQQFYKRYYWSAYTRLAWDEPALTITANANFLGSGRFTHPEQDRGITMREAARLMSFPDWFVFVTADAESAAVTDNIGVGMDMIGEAVPPLLGKAIAEHVISLLR